MTVRRFRRRPSLVTRINQYVPAPLSVPGTVVLHGSKGEVVGYMPSGATGSVAVSAAVSGQAAA